MAYDAGTAFLQIVPSFAGVVEAISAEASKWGDDAGGSFADTFRARVDTALANLPDAKINADSSEADAKIAAIRSELEGLSSQHVGIDISEADATAKLTEIHAELIELGASDPTIKVRVDDAAAALELGALGAESAVVGDGLKDVEIGAGGAGSGLSSLGSSAEGASAEFPGLITLVAALGTALIPIGGLALGALSALPALLAGGLSGIGALKLGLSGIGGAISDFSKTQAPSSGSGGNSAAIQAISDAESERNATESVTNATRELADARTNASETISADEKSISDAVKERNANVLAADKQVAQSGQQLATARQESTDSIHSAEERLTSAEQQVTAAIYSEKQAQDALVAARQAAQDQLTSYTDQLADGALQQQADALAVQQAQENLQTVQANPASTDLQISQAKLAVAQALQAVQDQSDSYAVLQRNAAAAAKAGVDGSSQVVDAQHNVTDAVQGVAQAQQDQSDASVALSEAEAAGAQNVANAELALQDAITAVSTATTTGNANISAAEKKLAQDRVKDAENIAVAEKAVTAALEDQSDTLKRISLQQADTSSGSGVESPAAKYAADLAGLSPAGRAFVEFVTGTIEPSLDKLKLKTQQALLPGLLSGLQALKPLFQPLSFFIEDAADSIGEFAKGLGDLLGSKQGAEDLNAIFDVGNGLMKSLGDDVTILVGAFLSLGAQAGPVVQAIADGAASIVQDFAKWVEDGGFEKFLGWLSSNGPSLVKTLEDIGVFIGKVIVFLAPFGGVVLDVLDGLGKIIAFIVDLPKTMREAEDKIGGFLNSIFADVISGLGAGGTWLWDHIGQPVVSFLTALPGDVVKASKGLWNGIGDAFIDVIDHIIDIWNDLKFTTPSFDIFGFHTPSVTLHTPHIDEIKQFADGTGSGQFLGGLAIVGEQGPELLNFQSPVQILSNKVLAGLGEGREGRSGPIVQVENQNFYDEADIDAFSQRLAFQMTASGY